MSGGFREQVVEFDDSSPEGADPWVVRPPSRPVEIVEYDPQWPTQAREVAERVQEALGLRALRIEHIGSTAVPGLPAKPIIDLDVTVADPGDESVWLPLLEAAGFVLTVREPWWYEHRVLRWGGRSGDTPDRSAQCPASNVHIFGPDSPELVRHVVFRNWLRSNAGDRELYSAAKREAAGGRPGAGEDVMTYNARKQTVIRQIYARAFRASGFLD